MVSAVQTRTPRLLRNKINQASCEYCTVWRRLFLSQEFYYSYTQVEVLGILKVFFTDVGLTQGHIKLTCYPKMIVQSAEASLVWT